MGRELGVIDDFLVCDLHKAECTPREWKWVCAHCKASVGYPHGDAISLVSSHVWSRKEGFAWQMPPWQPGMYQQIGTQNLRENEITQGPLCLSQDLLTWNSDWERYKSIERSLSAGSLFKWQQELGHSQKPGAPSDLLLSVRDPNTQIPLQVSK